MAGELSLFAGIRVGDLAVAQPWYERLLGSEPTFFPNDTEAVWQLAEEKFLYIEESPSGAGGGLATLIVDDLSDRVAAISGRGIAPTKDETYSNGVRKVTYHDPEGNEIGFGGVPDGA